MGRSPRTLTPTAKTDSHQGGLQPQGTKASRTPKSPKRPAAITAILGTETAQGKQKPQSTNEQTPTPTVRAETPQGELKPQGSKRNTNSREQQQRTSANRSQQEEEEEEERHNRGANQQNKMQTRHITAGRSSKALNNKHQPNRTTEGKKTNTPGCAESPETKIDRCQS